MNRLTSYGILVAVAAITLAGSAGPAMAAGQWGIAGFAGYNSFDMSDVNDEIAIANDDLATGGYSERLDEISSGIGFGGGIRHRMASGVIIGVDYERLTATSDVTISGATVEMDAGGNGFTGTVNYLFPSAGRARFGVAGGIGYYSSAGSVSAYDSGSGTSISADIEGNGIGFHGGATLDVALGQVARLEGLAGYRYAKATDIEVGGVGSSESIDWSGFMSRVGLAFYFGAQ